MDQGLAVVNKIKPIQGLVIYEGPSNLDSKPIVAIATGFQNRSTNRKTGQMIQIFIICQDLKPTSAWASDDYKTVCGDCKHGHAHGNSCYVDLARDGVNGVYAAYNRGSYMNMGSALLHMFEEESVRFGAYGDPAAVPYHVWDPILEVLKRTGGLWTSYTHQWKTCDPSYKDFCVASVDNLQELQEARAMGWRTFRTLTDSDVLQKGEFNCPATDEAWLRTGRKVQCIDCGACNGLADKSIKRGSAAILVHGTKWKVQNYITLRNQTELITV